MDGKGFVSDCRAGPSYRPTWLYEILRDPFPSDLPGAHDDLPARRGGGDHRRGGLLHRSLNLLLRRGSTGRREWQGRLHRHLEQ